MAGAVIGSAGLAPLYSAGGTGDPTHPSVVSSSGQFMVHDGRPKTAPQHQLTPEQKKKLVHLEPGVLAISAERVREGLIRELKLADQPGGLIHLVLYAPDDVPGAVTVVSTSFRDGWRFQLAVPEDVQPSAFVRGVVQAMLLELANRGSGRQSAEIPIWLTMGLATELEARIGPELVVSSVPAGYMVPDVRRLVGADPLRGTLEWLRASPPLSFTELSLPTPSLFEGENGKIYQCSAHLFVHSLLELKEGAHNLQRMLRELPNCWNWQIAFLRSFQEQFKSILDVEKWWSVVFIASTGRDAHQLLTREASLEKLAEILKTPIEIRTVTNKLPVRAVATVPEIVSHWDYDRQRKLFGEKLIRLGFLRVNSPLETVPLIDRYRQAFGYYVSKGSEIMFSPNAKRQIEGFHRILGSEFLQQWAVLENQRESMSRSQVSTAQAAK